MQYTKLNVGSRDEIKPAEEGWLNIDIEPLAKPRENFMQVNLFDMGPAWADTFEEVQAIHVLEHINRNERQNFVNALYRVTKPGGTCWIEVPDFKETIRLLHDAYEREDMQAQHIWTTSIYGKQRSPGDQHCWGYTNATLGGLCINAGFRVFGWDAFYQTPEGRNKIFKPVSSHYRAEPVLLGKGMKL